MTTGTYSTGTPASNDYYSKSWSGADDPLHRADNPYKVTIVKHHKALGAYRVNSSSPTCALNLSVTPPNATTLWTANDDLALLSKLAGKVKGHDFNLGTAAATSGQAVQQALSSIASIAGAMKALKRGDIGGAARALGVSAGNRKRKQVGGKLNSGDISGSWLAMQYGWLPTLSDVFEAWKAVEAHNSERKTKFFASRSVERVITGARNNVNYRSTHRTRKSIQYTLREELSVGRELGLTDPLSVAWEIMPWSFAIDWFIPIGTYLDTLNIIPKLKGSFCSTSKTRIDTVTEGWSTVTSLNQGCPAPIYLYENISFSRSIDLNPPRVPMPTFRAGLKGKRIFNAVALAHQLLR